MKRLRAFFFPVIMLFCSLATVSPAVGAPKLELKEQVFDFGQVTEGRVLEHEFLVFNKGNEPLQIQDVKTG